MALAMVIKSKRVKLQKYCGQMQSVQPSGYCAVQYCTLMQLWQYRVALAALVVKSGWVELNKYLIAQLVQPSSRFHSAVILR